MSDSRSFMRLWHSISDIDMGAIIALPGITPREYEYLSLICFEKVDTASAIAAKMGVSNASVTQILNAMEEKGYITRGRSETDARVHVLRPAPELVPLMESGDDLGSTAISKLRAEYGDESTDSFLKMVDTFANHLSVGSKRGAPVV